MTFDVKKGQLISFYQEYSYEGADQIVLVRALKDFDDNDLNPTAIDGLDRSELYASEFFAKFFAYLYKQEFFEIVEATKIHLTDDVNVEFINRGSTTDEDLLKEINKEANYD